MFPFQVFPLAFREHSTRVEVLFADTDAMGIVYYANYLRFFEAGRTAYVRTFGPEITGAMRDGEKLYFPVIDVHCRYRRSARVHDRLEVVTALREVKRASFSFAYRVLRAGDGELLAEGETEHTTIDGEGRVLRFDERLKTFFERATAPESPDDSPTAR